MYSSLNDFSKDHKIEISNSYKKDLPTFILVNGEIHDGADLLSFLQANLEPVMSLDYEDVLSHQQYGFIRYLHVTKEISEKDELLYPFVYTIAVIFQDRRDRNIGIIYNNKKVLSIKENFDLNLLKKSLFDYFEFEYNNWLIVNEERIKKENLLPDGMEYPAKAPIIRED